MCVCVWGLGIVLNMGESKSEQNGEDSESGGNGE